MKISDKNSKLGKIPNISLPPIGACAPDLPCFASCYALKAWKQYPSVRKAWTHNLEEMTRDPKAHFAAIKKWIQRKAPRFFRIHVAGDFLCQEHVKAWEHIASRCPETKFLAFTKRHDLDYSTRPANLEIVYSMWPGWGSANLPGRKAWVQDGTETRVPTDAIQCPGICDACGMCWSLSDINRDVVFNVH